VGGEVGEDVGDAVLVHGADDDAAAVAAGRGGRVVADDDTVEMARGAGMGTVTFRTAVPTVPLRA
jgi:hypothetical protein